MSDVCLSALGGCDPMPQRPRGIMAGILLMAAFEFDYPVELFISVKADNFPQHAFTLLLRLHVNCFLAEVGQVPNYRSAALAVKNGSFFT